MKKITLIISIILSITCSFAQVGIGTTTPDASSSLDISSNNSGLLIPRVSLTDINDGTTPINNPATSLLVYNTNAGVTSGNGVGYYYWNGTQWEKLQTLADGYWSRSPSGELFPKTITDKIGIGNTNPSYSLDISNRMRLRSGGNIFSTAGLWLNNLMNTSETAFIGMDSNNNVGFYGNAGAGWGLVMNNSNGNVGIGTSTPNEPLIVKSASYSNITTFDGANQMYITLAENGINRGYIGSYAGNPEDVELGTYGGNLGAVHLTTNNNPKLTVINNGNVGIGTQIPSEKLDIVGKIKITDGTEGVNKILTSDANGVGTWTASSATKFPVFGTFGTGATFYTTSAGQYTTASITLPPGKWAVSATLLILGDQVFGPPPFFIPTPRLSTGQSLWMRTYFSDSPVLPAATTNYIPGSSSLISGSLTGPEYFGLVNGTVFIENNSGGNKPYYLWAGFENMGAVLPVNFQITGFGSGYGEDQIIAIPMN